MHKCLYIIIFSLLITNNAYSKDITLKIISVELRCYPSKKPTRHKYEYLTAIVVKNISDKAIRVITGEIRTAVRRSIIDPKTNIAQDESITLGRNSSTHFDNDIPLIPSESELNIVALRPGEAAIIKDTKSLNAILINPVIHYEMKNIAAGRFNNWFGSVSSTKNTPINYKNKCTI